MSNSSEIPKPEKLHLVIHEPLSVDRPNTEELPEIVRDLSMRATKIVLSSLDSVPVVISDRMVGKEVYGKTSLKFYRLRVFDEAIAHQTGIAFEIQRTEPRVEPLIFLNHTTTSIALDGSKIQLESHDDDTRYFNSPLSIETPVNEIERDLVTNHDIIWLNMLLEHFEQ